MDGSFNTANRVKNKVVELLGMNVQNINIQDLAMIGDRRTCALLDKRGNIVWYCPKRFDSPSFFAALLDTEKGGIWSLELEGLAFESRTYLEDSALLQTYFSGEEGSIVLEDWMPLDGSFYGICRKLSAAPVPYTTSVSYRPNYSRRTPLLQALNNRHVSLEFDFHLHASHTLEINGYDVVCHVPADEEAWFILAEKALDKPEELLDESRELTLKNWRKVSDHITYKGPYEDEVRKSLRLLRMLTYAQNGGIIAAATTSLPEVVGGGRNYDYRYV